MSRSGIPSLHFEQSQDGWTNIMATVVLFLVGALACTLWRFLSRGRAEYGKLTVWGAHEYASLFYLAVISWTTVRRIGDAVETKAVMGNFSRSNPVTSYFLSGDVILYPLADWNVDTVAICLLFLTMFFKKMVMTPRWLVIVAHSVASLSLSGFTLCN
jgi:hypothetical protein